MHAPDGFLNAGTALATGAISVGSIGAALRQTGRRLQERQVPLAGVAAAFVFAAQMVNFPVAAGTTGHLLGGALAAILLGPATGVVVVSVVVAIQAVVFADGGLTALGYNALNMAVITAFGGYAAFRLMRRLLPATRMGVAAAAGLAGGISVVLASMAFSLEWLFGATVPVPFDTVFGAMVGVHLLIGIGEGLITGLTVATVLAVRPDLVHGAADLDRAQTADPGPMPVRAFAIAGILVSLLIAAVVSQFSSGDPDGLAAVATETGIAESAGDHALDHGIFARYATSGVENPTLGLALAGGAGVVISLAVVGGMVMAVRDRRPA